MRKWTVEEYKTRNIQHKANIKGKDIMEWSVADFIEHQKIVIQAVRMNGTPGFMSEIHENALSTLEFMVNAYNNAQEFIRSKGYGSTED